MINTIKLGVSLSFIRRGHFTFCVLIVMLGYSAAGWATYPALPTEFANSTSEIFVATDQNGHAIAAYTDSVGFPVERIVTYYFSDNQWIYMPIGIARGTVTGLAMSTNGTALITYVTDAFELRSVYFDGNVWFVPNTDPIAILPSDGTGGGRVSMDSTDLGVVIWSDATTYEIRTSFFLGDWGPPSIPGDIGTGIYPIIDIRTGSNGAVAMIAGWKDTSDTNIFISNFYANSWFGNPSIGAGTLGGVGIAAGRSVVVFREAGTEDIYGSHFFGSGLAGTVQLNPPLAIGATNTIPQMGISSGGTAMVTWGYSDTGSSQYDLYYAQFDGNMWLPAVNFQTGIPFTPPVISVNNEGSGLIFWGNFDPTLELYTAFIPGLDPIEPPVLVATSDTTEVLPLGVSLANNGRFNALVWGENLSEVDIFTPFGIASIQLPAPTGLAVSECPNSISASQSICANTITWDTSDDPNVASYNIERDGEFIANVPIAFGSQYIDENAVCGASTVYSIAAVDLDGVPGVEASITID